MSGLFSIFIFACGAFLVSCGGWSAALGVFCMLWGNNISRDIGARLSAAKLLDELTDATEETPDETDETS